MVNNSCYLDISYHCYGPSDHEIEILVETLKNRKLPPLFTLYIDQLLADHYLDELLKGKTLWFDAYNSALVKQGNHGYFKFEGNIRLHQIYKTMCEVIKLHSLDLKFENEWLSDPKCNELLYYDYKPCDYECKLGNGCRCDEGHEMLIGLRINRDKIECIYPKFDSTWQHCFLP